MGKRKKTPQKRRRELIKRIASVGALGFLSSISAKYLLQILSGKKNNFENDIYTTIGGAVGGAVEGELIHKELINKETINRKEFLKKLKNMIKMAFAGSILGTLIGTYIKNTDFKDNRKEEKRKEKIDLKKKPITLGYNKIYPEQPIKFINFPTITNEQLVKVAVPMEARIVRCLRWKPITDAVEDRYNIPRGLLMAMMAQEGIGDPTLPNIKNYKKIKNKFTITASDGGLGLLHIQTRNAYLFGLKTILKRPEKKMNDPNAGKKIIKAYYEKHTNLQELAKIDERRHPIMAVDVAARFLKDIYIRDNSTSPKGKDARLIALKGYSGRKFSDYGSKVLKYRSVINKITGEDMPTFTEKTEQAIQKYLKSKECKKTKEAYDNIIVKIGGTKGGTKEYYEYFAWQCENYGLENYVKLEK